MNKFLNRHLVFMVNAAIDFIGYFVNSFAFIFIFGDPGGYWGGGTLGEILLGIIAFLIISLINVTVNMIMFRHWNPDESYKNAEFIIPICAYVIFDILYPLYRILF